MDSLVGFFMLQIQACIREGKTISLFPDLRMQYSGSDVLLILLGDPTYPLQWFLVTLAEDG